MCYLHTLENAYNQTARIVITVFVFVRLQTFCASFKARFGHEEVKSCCKADFDCFSRRSIARLVTQSCRTGLATGPQHPVRV